MAISSDNVGNHFFGTYYDTQSTITKAKEEVNTLLANALGSTSRFSARSNINEVIDWRPNIVEELMTSSVAGSNSLVINSVRPTSFARFSHLFAAQSGAINNSSYSFSAIATNDDATSHATNERIYGIPANTNGFTTFYNAENPVWITANAHSIASFNFNRASSSYFFNYTGVLQAFSSLFGVFPRNCCAITAGKDDNNNFVADAYRVGVQNTNTKQQVLTSGGANYSITCADGQNPQSDLWATDLYLHDDDGNTNPATGRCSNLLLAKGGSFTIGTAYRLNTDHIDGGSKIFICCADFGSDKILMRIKNDN